jgi:hypothetical protein
MRTEGSAVRAGLQRIKNPAVRAVFAEWPTPLRIKLLALRQLILDTADRTPGVGPLDETLKWNEPAYVTAESGSGSTIRINRKSGSASKYSMYFNCNTDLVDSFRTLFPTAFHYLGNREIEFDVQEELAIRPLSMCISMALTYHRNKKK